MPCLSYMYIYNIIADTDLSAEKRKTRHQGRERVEKGTEGDSEMGTRREQNAFLSSLNRLQAFAPIFSTSHTRLVFAGASVPGLGAKRPLPVANSFPKREHVRPVEGDALITLAARLDVRTPVTVASSRDSALFFTRPPYSDKFLSVQSFERSFNRGATHPAFQLAISSRCSFFSFFYSLHFLYSLCAFESRSISA